MSEVKDPNVRSRLIDEAARILAVDGPAGLSLRRLAARAGTSTMAVYTQFGSKPQVLAAKHREGFRRLGAALRTVAERPDTGLMDLGRAYRTAALASPHLYHLMFGPQPADLVISGDDRSAAESTLSFLTVGVQNAVAAGLIVGDPARIGQHLWAVAHGMVSLELSGRLPGPAEIGYDDALYLAARPFRPDPIGKG